MKYTRYSHPDKTETQQYWKALFDERFTYETALLMFAMTNRDLCEVEEIKGQETIIFSQSKSYENNPRARYRLVVLRDNEGNDIGRVSRDTYHDIVTIDRLV